MSSLLISFVGALLATNQPAALSNVLAQATGLQVQAITNRANDPVEQEYQRLLESDDAAQREVDRWIQQNTEFAAKGAGIPDAELNRKIQARFEPVENAYKDFLKRHTTHARAYVAYASFLGDMGDEEGAEKQLLIALSVDTNNPAIYNNLANIYSHVGPIRKAFDFYARAIQLEPREPTYYHNLGTAVFLFRKDAVEHYGINEQEVFARAFAHYSNAIRLDPDNFPLASDVAQTYYGVTPMPVEKALRAWTNAFKIARDDIEREGVYVHYARIKTIAGKFDEARAILNSITNAMYADSKRRLLRNVNEREADVKEGTVSPAAEK